MHDFPRNQNTPRAEVCPGILFVRFLAIAGNFW